MKKVLVLVMFAVGCGPGGDNPDGGGGDGGTVVTDADYFNLNLGTCQVLQGGLADAERMTIGAEVENDALGFTATQVRYRINGLLRRTDYVTFENGEALIHRRNIRSNPALIMDFDPPITWLRRPVFSTGTTPIRTDTTATDVNAVQDYTWTVNVTVSDPETLTVPYQTEPIEANPIFVVYDRTDTVPASSEQDRFHFTAELGFIRADLHGTQWPQMDLLEIRQMQAGAVTCGS